MRFPEKGGHNEDCRQAATSDVCQGRQAIFMRFGLEIANKFQCWCVIIKTIHHKWLKIAEVLHAL